METLHAGKLTDLQGFNFFFWQYLSTPVHFYVGILNNSPAHISELPRNSSYTLKGSLESTI